MVLQSLTKDSQIDARQKGICSYIAGISGTVLLVAALLCVMPTASFARDCDDGSQAGMNQCAYDDANKADAELDKTYNALLEQISPEGQVKLKTARESWLKYRKDQCAFNGFGTRDGSVHPMIISNCYRDLTRNYIKELQYQLHCEEGNLSCGNQ